MVARGLGVIVRYLSNGLWDGGRGVIGKGGNIYGDNFWDTGVFEYYVRVIKSGFKIKFPILVPGPPAGPSLPRLQPTVVFFTTISFRTIDTVYKHQSTCRLLLSAKSSQSSITILAQIN